MVDGKKIFGAIAVGIALFFFWPAVVGGWQQVSALRQAVADRQDILTQRTKILANAASAYQEYTAKLSAPDGEKFGALVPVHKNQAELLSAMQDIAANSGITVDQITISDSPSTTSTTMYKTFSLGMDLEGSYQAFRTFLNDLEQYVRLLNVASIDIAENGQTAGLKFTVRADTYFLK